MMTGLPRRAGPNTPGRFAHLMSGRVVDKENVMTYSTDSGGYGVPPQNPNLGGYGAPVPSYPNASSGTGAGRGLSFLFALGVVILGVLSFCLGFMPYEKQSATGQPPTKSSVNFFDNVGLGVGVAGLALLLAAAVVAVFGMLPKQSGNEPVVAGLSVAGFVSLLMLLIGLVDTVEAGVGLILVLVSSFLQASLAVGCVLFSAGVVKSGSSAQYGYGGQGAYASPQTYQPRPYQQQPYRPQQPQAPYYGAAPGSAPTSEVPNPPPDNRAPRVQQPKANDPTQQV